MDEKTRRKLEDKDLAEAVRKASEEVDEFIANLKPKEYSDGWPQDKWEEEMEKHPLFTSALKEEEELPPLIEAFQVLKYSPDCNSPVEIAQAYKEDGNEHFKKKDYHHAELAYTEALKAQCDDDKLNSILYSNRSAAYFNMGRYNKALEDASKSIELNPSNVKAYFRSAQCYLKMDRYDECISLCENGLKLKKNDKAILELKNKALRQIERKKMSLKELEVKKEALEKLNDSIRQRGINLIDGGITLESLEVDYGGAVAQVHMTDEGVLMWPVILFYPQYNTSDFIPAFNEEICFFEYLMDFFVEPAKWDSNLEYTIDNLKIYFPDSDGNIIPVEEMLTLKSVMQNKRFKVTTGNLSFFITSSQYNPVYRAKNHVVEF